MTEPQARVLRCIQDFTAVHGHSPTFAQIAAELGFKSKSSVHRAVVALTDQGLLQRHPGARGGVDLVTPRVAEATDEELAAELRRRGYLVPALETADG